MEHFGLCFQMPTLKVLWPLLPLNFKLGNIGYPEIITEYYWMKLLLLLIVLS